MKKDIIPDIKIKVSVEEEIRFYMLRDKVEDSVLNKAIEIIKGNRVAGMIEFSIVHK